LEAGKDLRNKEIAYKDASLIVGNFTFSTDGVLSLPTKVGNYEIIMANLEQAQDTTCPLETAKIATARSLSLLQWTDLPCSVLAAQPSELIHSFCVQSEQAADLLTTACKRTQEEAQNLRHALYALKSQLAEKRVREGESSGTGDAAGLYNSLVVNSLYDHVETPVCYLTQASPLCRIMMKRRLFTYAFI